MIYQFKNGPSDGLAKNLPEFPVGAIIRFPVLTNQACFIWQPDFVDYETAIYRVIDIGEAKFEGFQRG